jgi:thiosulfate dehydrogenase [quinone] large subunit
MSTTEHAPSEGTATVNGGVRIETLRPAHPTPTAHPSGSDSTFARRVWAVARISLGWIFLWPFLDKLIGLGHETPSAESWLNGGNPTKGFLSGAVGPFAGIYHDIAGAGVINVLFMAGLLGIGVALMLGIAMWPACVAGATMLVLMWSASLPPANNLFMDEHLIYATVLIGLAAVGAGKTLGLGERWTRSRLVQRYPGLA